MTATISLPTTPVEADAFVAGVMSAPEVHAHGASAGMAMEHMQLLALVDRAEATHVAIAHGDWFDPATWHEGRIPEAGARVLIPDGVRVTYDGESDASLFTVRVDGELSFATETDTRMVVDTFVVSPSGRLQIGTADNPVDANVRTEIVIANNGDIDVGWDPLLLSRGLISHGEVEIHGAEKTTFLKVDSAPMAGDTEITLQEVPQGWQVGDTIVLTGTHKQGWGWDNTLGRVVHRESEDEEVTITAIDGNLITIDRPLQHDHDTPRDDLSAYVSNMSRNITVRSEDGEATEVPHRGHVMFMHSDEVDVRYAAFDDLGRTDKSIPAADVGTFSTIEADSNVKGRYSLHLHLTGTEDQDDPSFLVGNAVSGSPGWGIVQHSSHSVIVDNAVFDAFGAAFAAEDGDETGVWGSNIAIRSQGADWGEASAKLQSDLARHDNGRTGDGFFFAGRLVEAVDNVAANTTHGFVWMHRSAPSDPLSANLEHPEIAYGSDTMRLDQAPIQGFRDNEAFGTQVGLIVIKADSRQEHEVRTDLDGFLNWETYGGMDLTYTSHYTISDVDLLAAEGSYAEFGYRLGGNAFDMVVNGMQIEGFDRGVDFTTNIFTFPVTDADVGHVFIDVEQTGVGSEYVGFNPARHRIMSSDELVEGRLAFDMTGDLTLSPGETLFFNGTKTDSLGSRDRQFASMDDIQSASFQENIVPLLQSEGYYTAPDGRHILLVEDFIADRATGELLKFAHQVTLQMSDAQLASLGATNNGPITLGGSAPITTDDTATVAPGEAVIIDVLANDRDPDGGPLRVDGITQPDQGFAQMGPGGTIVFVAGFNSEDTETFTYWAADASGNFTPAQVTVTIDATGTPPPPPTNTNPVARNDTVTATLSNGAILVDPNQLLANDTDADGDTLSIANLLGAQIQNNMIRVTAPVTNGQATFQYTVSDGNGGSDTANAIVIVPDQGSAPITENGTSGDDTLVGGPLDDSLFGAGGDDLIRGRQGDDLLRGSRGEDTLFGGPGDDEIIGGKGRDAINGGRGNDSLIGGGQDDSLFGAGGDDVIRGRQGDDLLRGSRGEDTLFGGSGDDKIVGGKGRDVINGGRGNDSLTGSNGADTFVFKNGFGNDTITDFSLSNREKIDLSSITGVSGSNDLFNDHLRQEGLDVVFDDLRGNTITIENTNLGALVNGDFILS
ncbi:MAG: cadherin-like domain-containing protein [Pseudomonadota bacterium]